MYTVQSLLTSTRSLSQLREGCIDVLVTITLCDAVVKTTADSLCLPSTNVCMVLNDLVSIKSRLESVLSGDRRGLQLPRQASSTASIPEKRELEELCPEASRDRSKRTDAEVY